MQKDKFYQAPSDASRAKQAIVATYFGAWKNVLKTWRNRPKLGYVDIYSGPGMYADGSYSTPLLILEQAIQDDYLRDKLVAVFNDGDPQRADELRKNIANLPGIERLKNQPKVHEFSVSEKMVHLASDIPSLLFADPWGYKGLSIALIKRFLDVAGTDCIFFFNYRRINAGLGYEAFDEPLDAVFGADRAEALRSIVRQLPPSERERLIVGEMQAALKEVGAHCALPFRFVSADSYRTSHHLLFASKHSLGCQIMKNVMREHSSSLVQGIGSFEFKGTPPGFEQLPIPGLGPLDELAVDLARTFAGRTIVVSELISKGDHPTAVERNYKDAVLQLEAEGKVTVEVPGRKRRKLEDKLTLPDDAVVRFREEGECNG